MHERFFAATSVLSMAVLSSGFAHAIGLRPPPGTFKPAVDHFDTINPNEFHTQLGMQQNPPSGFVFSDIFAIGHVPNFTPPGGFMIDPGIVAYYIGAATYKADGSPSTLVQPVLASGKTWDCNLGDTTDWFILAYRLDDNQHSTCGQAVRVNQGDEIFFELASTLDVAGGTTTWDIRVTDVTINVSSTLTATVPVEPTNVAVFSQEWARPISCQSTPSMDFNYIQLAATPVAVGRTEYRSVPVFPYRFLAGQLTHCSYAVSFDLPFGASDPFEGQILWTE